MVFGAGAAAALAELGLAAPQLHHHLERRFSEPLRRPGAIEGKGRPHGPAGPTVGAPERFGQCGAQARGAALELLLQAERRVRPVASQLLDHPP